MMMGSNQMPSSTMVSLLPLTEGESEQMFLPNSESFETKMAEEVLPTSLHPRFPRPASLRQNEGLRITTRPSILCVTQKWAFMPLYIVLVSKVHVCLYILEKVEIWQGDTDVSQTTEDRATQLLYSIQFKLSHAILGINEFELSGCIPLVLIQKIFLQQKKRHLFVEAIDKAFNIVCAH